jgi:hypothetical protein
MKEHKKRQQQTEDKRSNFWQTLPGILTGLAALVTAIASCLAIFVNSPRILDSLLPPGSSARTTPVTPPFVQVAVTELPTPRATAPLGEWVVVTGGGFGSLREATEYAKRFTPLGYAYAVVYRNNDIRVILTGFPTQARAEAEMGKIHGVNPAAYTRKLSDWCPIPVSYDDHIECR